MGYEKKYEFSCETKISKSMKKKAHKIELDSFNYRAPFSILFVFCFVLFCFVFFNRKITYRYSKIGLSRKCF